MVNSLKLRSFIVAVAGVAAIVPPVVPFGDSAEIHVCSDSIIRVTHRPTPAAVSKKSLISKADWQPVAFSSKTDGDITTVETAKLSIKLSASEGRVIFSDKTTGKVVLQERNTAFTPTQDMGQSTYQVEQAWEETSSSEGLYGGGSYQNGFMNFKNAPLEMIQFNTEAVVPFFTSTNGYGLLWDNYAWTYLNPPSNVLVAPAGAASGTVDFTPEADGDHFFFVGKAFPTAGVKPAFGNGMTREVYITLTDSNGTVIEVQSWDKLTNLPNSITGRATDLKKGASYKVAYSWNIPAGLFVQGPEYGQTALRSFVGDLVDYYFVYGETMGQSLAGYREITGAAPIYAKWVYGFWQCKEHYATQDGLLTAAHGFRNRSIPVDAFVQDWHYWGDMGWGPQWDPKVYPDPEGMVKELSEMNIHLMVSVWSKFDKSTTFWKQMHEKNWILGDSEYYDAFTPEARELYYNFSNEAHFSIGVDSLWQDATEPENFPNTDQKCGQESCNANFNAYSLETTRAISDGLRRDYPTKQGARVFTLTRSSFAAQQTTGATLWSGDISGAWDSLRRQISSSLNYALSGMPYWAQDIGGFFRPNDQYDSPDYHDMLTRWFQFGVFTPIFRVHGGGTNTELWNFGDDVMRQINSSAINLRYRLLPYTYSGFARVEQEGYTMQRALQMDFTDDLATRTIADVFMYGDALLVAPLHTPGRPSGQCGGISKDAGLDRNGGDYIASAASTVDECARRCCADDRCMAYSFGSSTAGQSCSSCTAGQPCCWLKDTVPAQSARETSTSGVAKRARVSTRQVYFPKGEWVQFHTGAVHQSGNSNVTFPLEQAPVFVRAGSIVPLGPLVQHTAEKQADPMEVRVYPGADAKFQLFEDDGASSSYRQGKAATIGFEWNEAKQELTISTRQGSFPGMLKTRTFNVVFVKPGHGGGVEETEKPDAAIMYKGSAVTVRRVSALVV